jgi:2-(1,2-epoxy-1,2-dihydrophenyl)acetyl-CoA isomerase
MSTDTATGTVRLERRDGAAWITLNRPDALNAWTEPLGRELRAAVEEVSADPEVRAVCITGEGRGFSAGADLRDITGRRQTASGSPDVETTLRGVYHPIITGIRRMPKPVVAAVNGPAAGIGCSLALACDVVVAKESSFFLLAFVNIGLMPDGGSTVLVPARIGYARAAEMALLGERVPARRALDWGLITRVLPDEGFDAGVDELVGKLAAGPTRSYAASKHALNAWLYRGMEDQLELEAVHQQRLAASPDFAEGVTAFLEKRPPAFRGE